MAKKPKPSEIRAAKMQSRQEQYRRDAEEQARRKAEEEARRKKEEEQKKIEKLSETIRKAGLVDKKDRKASTAKAAGLKSVFTMGDGTQLLTSFGDGNVAIPEKRIRDNAVENMQNNFGMDVEEKRYKIHGRTEGTTDNPAAYGKKVCEEKKDSEEKKRESREDMLHAKADLEKLYFGKTFADNLHIQIIYNIMDIKKILAVHSTNIVYALDNLTRNGKYAEKDVVGSGTAFDIRNSYEKAMEKYGDTIHAFATEERLIYFGNAFYNKTPQKQRYKLGKAFYDAHPEAYQKLLKKNLDKKKLQEAIEKKAPNYISKSEKDIYYLISLMSGMRQICVHSTDGEGETNLYKLDSVIHKDAKTVLNAVYNAKIHDFNADGFMKTSAPSNLRILFLTMGLQTEAEKKELATKLYNFSIRKVYKEMGFSLKILREALIELVDTGIRNQDNDSKRAKLYQLFDFILWDYYKQNEDERKQLTQTLRAASVSKDDKQRDMAIAAVYSGEALRILPSVKDKMKKAYEHVCNYNHGKEGESEYTIKNGTPEYNTLKEAVKETEIGNDETVSYFTKLMYAMTLFLDGKEINDLITTVSSKMDNIASLLNVAVKEYGEVKFSEPFAFFNSDVFLQPDEENGYACKPVEELRELNSFARMTEEKVFAQCQYVDAAKLLGFDYTREDLCDYLDAKLLDKTKLPKRYDNKQKRDVADMGLRNFVINNVLKSRRFKYIVRYTNPEEIRTCLKNRDLLRFVFRDIPDNQINRYCQACDIKNVQTREGKVEKLLDLICDLNFKSALDVNQHASQTDANKQLKRTVISLYLNVLYQIAKNLVYVNARYVMAFHCLERDKKLYNEREGKPNKKETEKDWTSLAEEFLEKHYKNNAHARSYLQTNLSNLQWKEDNGDWVIVFFRDKVAHLNTVCNTVEFLKDAKVGDCKTYSYFQLYHYLVQRLFIKERYDRYVKETNGKLMHKNDDVWNECNPKLEEYAANVMRYGTYCKDFVKVLCVPFGYNLARFKNLSIDGLFDRNDKREPAASTKYED